MSATWPTCWLGGRRASPSRDHRVPVGLNRPNRGDVIPRVEPAPLVLLGKPRQRIEIKLDAKPGRGRHPHRTLDEVQNPFLYDILGQVGVVRVAGVGQLRSR